jgi:hypothetical protein
MTINIDKDYQIMMLTFALCVIASYTTSFSLSEEKNLVLEEKTEPYSSPKLPLFDTIRIDRATRYNPTESQCDSTPFNTADGTFIDTNKLRRKEIRYCALSWDLIKDSYRCKVRNEKWAWRGLIEFGDTIHIQSKSKPFINGEYLVCDVMNSRYRKSIDILVHEDNMNPRMGVLKDLIITIKK